MANLFRPIIFSTGSIGSLGPRKPDRANRTTTPFGKFVYQISNVFAELERNIIRKRTITAMNAAR